MKGDTEITELLYTSDKEREDHLSVRDLNNGENSFIRSYKEAAYRETLDISEESEISMRISQAEKKCFEVRMGVVTEKPFLYMEYKVRIVFRRFPLLEWAVVIPRNGKFSDDGDAGEHPIMKQAVLNCAAAIDVTLREAAEPVRSGIELSSSEDGGAYRKVQTSNERRQRRSGRQLKPRKRYEAKDE